MGRLWKATGGDHVPPRQGWLVEDRALEVVSGAFPGCYCRGQAKGE